MPLVFTQNEINLADVEYGDVLGELYEFPSQYINIVKPGEQFVYYRGKRRADGSIGTPNYFGTGIVGAVNTVGERYQCSITNYQPFDPPVPFRIGDLYLEPTANTRKAVGFYFQQGVRKLDQIAFDAICAIGLKSSKAIGSKGYSTDSAEVDAVAMELALKEAVSRWPGMAVVRMPHNNPGFDIEIRSGDNPIHYIEVKGTRANEARFFISAGELAHSELHADNYSIWIFYSLNLVEKTAQLATHDGAVSGEHFDLRPTQFFGRLLKPE